MTRILPERRSIIIGRVALKRRGKGSTKAAKVWAHSVSVASAARVVGAAYAKFATRMSMTPASRTTAYAAPGSRSGAVLRTTTAPCSASTSQSMGPMNSSACVTKTRLPVSVCVMVEQYYMSKSTQAYNDL